MKWMGFATSAWLLILFQALLGLCSGIAGIFVNIFLWKIHPDLTTLAAFNLWMYVSVLVSVVIAGYLARLWDRKSLLLIGIVGYVAFYALTLMLQQRCIHHLALLGILQGIGLGFVAIAQHVLTFDTTNNEFRDRFYAISGFVGSAIGMIAPLISGWFITQFPGIHGYQYIFSVTLVLFILAGVVAALFPSHGVRSRLELGEAILPRRTPREWHAMLMIQAFLGFRDGLFGFMVSIFIFIAMKNELGVGQFNFFASILSLVIFLVLNRTIRIQNRLLFICVGSVGTFVATVVVSVDPGFWGILIFNIGLTVFGPCFNIPVGSMAFEIISSIPKGAERRIEFIVAREIPLGIGRIVSIFVFLWMDTYFSSWMVTKFMLPVLSLFLVAAWWILQRYGRPTVNIRNLQDSMGSI